MFHPSHPSHGPASGTLHQQGVDNLYAQEQQAAAELAQHAKLAGRRDQISSSQAVPRLPADQAASSVLVHEERARLGSERLFSPSAATVSPRGTGYVAINERDSRGMPLARYLSAEAEKVVPPKGVRPPLDPRLYKQSQPDARVPRLPLSKLWTQGPMPDEPSITATAPIPAPTPPPPPESLKPAAHDDWEARRIDQMQARVARLGPRYIEQAGGPMERLCEPTMPHERSVVVPRSPAFARVVQEERNRQQQTGTMHALHGGLRHETELGRSQGHAISAPPGGDKPAPLDGSVFEQGALDRASPPPLPVPEPASTGELAARQPRPRTIIEKTDRLYENFSERHTAAAASVRPDDFDHQRFMAHEMRRVEKIIDKIDEDDYEMYMYEENRKVAQELNQKPSSTIPVAKPRAPDSADAQQALKQEQALERAMAERAAEEQLRAQFAAAERAKEQAAAEREAAERAVRIERQRAEFEQDKQREAAAREAKQQAVRAEKQREAEALERAMAERAAEEQLRAQFAAAERAKEQAALQREAEIQRAEQAARQAEAVRQAEMHRVEQAQRARAEQQSRESSQRANQNQRAPDSTLARSQAAVDAAMGNRPKRTPRTPREMRESRRSPGGRSGRSDEEKKAMRDRQNEELAAERQERAHGMSSQAARNPAGRRAEMSANEAQARLQAATADLDEDDLADFNAMMAEEAAKHS